MTEKIRLTPRLLKTCRGCKDHFFRGGAGWCKRTGKFCKPDFCEDSRIIEVDVHEEIKNALLKWTTHKASISGELR